MKSYLAKNSSHLKRFSKCTSNDDGYVGTSLGWTSILFCLTKINFSLKFALNVMKRFFFQIFISFEGYLSF
jgi:hypothetical protein